MEQLEIRAFMEHVRKNRIRHTGQIERGHRPSWGRMREGRSKTADQAVARNCEGVVAGGGGVRLKAKSGWVPRITIYVCCLIYCLYHEYITYSNRSRCMYCTLYVLGP